MDNIYYYLLMKNKGIATCLVWKTILPVIKVVVGVMVPACLTERLKSRTDT